MSADDVKARFPQITLDTVKRSKLAKLIDDGKLSKALELKREIDGPLQGARVVDLFSGRRLNILLERIERSMS